MRKAKLKFNRIITSYKTIIENLTESFHPEEIEATKKYDLIVSDQIEKGIRQEAKRMYDAFGILPEDFFGQSLQGFLAVNMVFVGAETIGESIIAQIDETNF